MRSMRKLVGTLAILGLVVLYVAFALIALAFAEGRLAQLPEWGRMIVYAIVGLAWIFPAMAIIVWMEKPRKKA